MSDKQERGFEVKALGEIAIRCTDLVAMTDFYENIIGLKRLEGKYEKGIVFLKVAEGYQGHTAILALFSSDIDQDPSLSRNTTVAGLNSSLHHIALTVSYADQDAAMKWYKKNELECREELFGWVGWRGVFTKDPEGNTVELVAYDKSLLSKM